MDFPRLAAYLAELSENNRREWFEAHRAEYQALRDRFCAFVGEVIARVAEWDDTVRWVDPKDCVFRIYRDVRFSRDKTPYKTTFSASIGERGRKGPDPGYYLQVDEKGVLMAAGGVYMPDAGRLARIREHVAEHPERLEAILRRRDFERAFGGIWDEQKLKRPPRGYSEDTPLIDVVKLKSFIVIRERDVSSETGDVLPWMLDTFRAMHPFLLWLREALAGAEEPAM